MHVHFCAFLCIMFWVFCVFPTNVVSKMHPHKHSGTLRKALDLRRRTMLMLMWNGDIEGRFQTVLAGSHHLYFGPNVLCMFVLCKFQGACATPPPPLLHEQ